MIPEKLLEKAKAKGSTEQYFKWLSYMPSALTGLYGEFHDGVGRNDPAHHRTVSNGSGVASKPPYSGIPLTHDEHMMQHQKGASILAPQDWWDYEAVHHLTMWINGVKPPELKEESRKVFVFKSAGGFVGLWLWAKRFFLGGKKALRVTVEETTMRSNQQNNSQWGVIYQDLVDFYKDNPIAFGKDVALYAIERRLDETLVHEMMKVLCNDGKSTRTGKNAHSEYFTNIAHHFIERHNHEVKMPVNNKGYNEFN
jgi:hypothetical protein